MLRQDDLVGLPDFPLGALTVSPSRRVVERDGQSIAVEPRVMQVLVLLAREPGAVVARHALFDEIWGGVPVGEDSLNRAVGGARKALALDPDNLELETIPRTGYRLNIRAQEANGAMPLSRRRLIAGSAAGAGLVAAGASWWLYERGNRQRFASLLARGRDALDYGDQSALAADLFRQAVRMRPQDPQALGLFAYAQAVRTDTVPAVDAPAALREAEAAATAALERDSRQPHGLLAEVILQRPVLDFAETEQRLRAVLGRDPRNLEAMRLLWNLKQCVGRSREALALVQRALTAAPLAASANFPHAQLLWIVGRVPEADRVIERALHYWPGHRWVRFARFTILAYTDRPRAALAMLEREELRPQNFTREGIALWRINLAALEQRSPSTVGAALDASLKAARGNLQLASQAVSALSALGEVDAAFEVANALFAVGASERPARAKSTAWRFAPWLFTPPVAAMRADPRFGAVCDAAGLTDYWAGRGVQPDYRTGLA